MNSSRKLCGSGLLFVFLAAGCASTGVFKLGKDDFPRSSPKNPVVQVIPMWQASSGVGLDDRTCRGFAGQIFFVTEESPGPALVDGEVSIWVFDDQGTSEEQAKPLHQFKFEREAWRAYARKGPIGLTYSVFIPYTRKGAHEARCTLLLQYTPPEGAIIRSEMINIELPGIKPKTLDEKNKPDGQAAEMSETVAAALRTSAAKTERKTSQRRPDLAQAAADALARATRENPAPRRLTTADQERIVRETRARLAADDPDGDDSPLTVYRAQRRPRRNPLDDDETVGNAGNQNEVDEVSGASDSLTPQRANRRIELDDDEQPHRRDSDRRKAGRHPIGAVQADEADSFGEQDSERRRQEYLSIVEEPTRGDHDEYDDF